MMIIYLKITIKYHFQFIFIDHNYLQILYFLDPIFYFLLFLSVILIIQSFQDFLFSQVAFIILLFLPLSIILFLLFIQEFLFF